MKRTIRLAIVCAISFCSISLAQLAHEETGLGGVAVESQQTETGPQQFVFADVTLKPDQMAVQYVLEHQWLKPLPNNPQDEAGVPLFLPDKPITRAQFVLMLYGVSGMQTHFVSEFPYFRDVPNEHEAYVAIERLRRFHVLVRDDQGFFYPNASLTRRDAGVMFSRTLDVSLDRPLLTLSEAEVAAVFETYHVKTSNLLWYSLDDQVHLARCAYLGFLVPRFKDEKVTLALDEPLTRLEAVRMIYQHAMFDETVPLPTDAQLAVLPAGITFHITPTSAVFEERTDVGEVLYFAMTEEVTLSQTNQTFPRGSRLSGEVVEVPADHRQALVVLDKLMLPNGKTLRLDAELLLFFDETHGNHAFIVPGEVFQVKTRD